MMVRYTGILILGLTAMANLNAGPVMLGGPNGLQTVQAAGSITDTSSPGTANAVPVPYSATVLQGTVNSAGNTISSGVLCAGFAASSAANCTANSGTVQTSLPYTGAGTPEYMAGANGITFAMIDQASLPNSSLWTTSNSATATSIITIPMGIFGVTDVYTMLNDNFGVQGATPASTITVAFQFSSGTETFSLVDGAVIRDSWECTSGTGVSNAAGGCQNYQTSNGSGGFFDKLDTTHTYHEDGTTTGSSAATVTAFNVITTAYSNIIAGANPYKNTSGNIYLDAQHFSFGSAYAGASLNSIVITDTVTQASQSRVELSAIDYSAPEPGTVFLFVSGLGLVGLVRRQRKA